MPPLFFKGVELLMPLGESADCGRIKIVEIQGSEMPWEFLP